MESCSPVSSRPAGSLWARLLAVLVLMLAGLALSGAPAQAQLQEGSPPPPFTGPGPTAPGLYAGIKDRDGTAVSWVRVSGLKDRGDLVPYLRGSWGQGTVNVPLVDVYMMEFNYSQGHIQADLRLLTGEAMHMQLLNPYTQLEGWWRDNPYSITLSGVHQAWFRYIPRAQVSADRYTGPPVRIRKTGIVRTIELSGTGGYLVLVTARGETLDLHFTYGRVRAGEDVVRRKAPWLAGRPVRVIYQLTATRDGHAHRELQEIDLLRPSPSDE